MNRRLAVPLAALLLGLGSWSCAVTGGENSAYAPRAMPAARLALPQSERVFYDELTGYGDWVLIEPYGFVFRPRVNFVAWRPYLDGWWQPSDVYGWVWISEEPFGWITYHYGNWFYDRFQGWVWMPDNQWGPAWVAWASADDWFGWAPLGPAGYGGYDRAPGGVFTYLRASQLADAGPERSMQFVTTVAPKTESLTAIVNVGRENGVTFNRGPSFETIERVLKSPVRTVPRPDVQRAPVEPAGGSGANGEARLLAATRLLLDAGDREFKAAREGRLAPMDPPLIPRAPIQRDPARPPKPAAEPARDTTQVKGGPGPGEHATPRGLAPADSAASRGKASPPREHRAPKSGESRARAKAAGRDSTGH